MRFQDLTEGRTFDLGVLRLSSDEIMAFARDFDPQPQHLDAEAAAKTVLGGLCASGWQTCAALNRMIIDALDLHDSAVTIARFDDVRWKAPVFADLDHPVRGEITSADEASAVLTVEALMKNGAAAALMKARLTPERTAA